jgi:hypothetical protein
MKGFFWKKRRKRKKRVLKIKLDIPLIVGMDTGGAEVMVMEKAAKVVEKVAVE